MQLYLGMCILIQNALGHALCFFGRCADSWNKEREIGCYVHNCMFFPVRLWCMHRQAMGHPVACKESAFSRKFMTQVNVERKIVHVQWRQ